MTDSTRERAEVSVTRRFTRLMAATTSPFGVLTDPAFVALLTALGLVACLSAMVQQAPLSVVHAAQALFVAPLIVAVMTFVLLQGARSRVVAWLASLPFAVDNLNGVLNGVGEELVVQFASETLVETKALNANLDAVHPDAFVTSSGDEPGLVEIRIGVVDSKWNPSGANHRRYARVRDLIDKVLVPLHATTPIVSVRVK